jgi:tetratricopeptide (TPR) repeat protein
VHFKRAWELLQQADSTSDTALRLEVLDGRGWAELELARWPECVTTYEHARALSDDPLYRARAANLIAFAKHHTGETSGALAECEAGLKELDSLNTPDAIEARLRIQTQIAFIRYLQGRYKQIVQIGEEMVRIAMRLGRQRAISVAHLVLAWGHMGSGEVDAAIEHFQESTAAAESFGERVFIATSYENLGYQNYLGGRFAAARGDLEHAIALYRDSASDLRAVNALQHLCRVNVAEGDLETAMDEVAVAVDLATGGQERWAADGLQILGDIHVLRAQWDQARASFERALAIRRAVGDTAGTIESLVGISGVDRSVSDFEAATAVLHEALQIANAIDPSPPVVLAHRASGQVAMLVGDLERWKLEVHRAFQLAQAMQHSLEYAPAALAMAELLSQDGDLADAEEAASVALERAGPLSVRSEAHSLLACITTAAGHPDRAQSHAVEAIKAADRLRSPLLLSRACIAAALSGLAPEVHRQVALRQAMSAGVLPQLLAFEGLFDLASR